MHDDRKEIMLQFTMLEADDAMEISELNNVKTLRRKEWQTDNEIASTTSYLSIH